MRREHRLPKQSDVIQRAKLIVHNLAVVLVAIHLQCAETEHKPGRHRMAKRAFGTTRKVPSLFADAAGRIGVVNREFAIQARPTGEQNGVSLLVIPDVGVPARGSAPSEESASQAGGG